MSVKTSAKVGYVSAAIALAVVVAAPAAALRVDATDVPTVFYVTKSDDRNRVDYGIRLDDRCRPDRDQPIFVYWRRFEPGQSRFGDLSFLDRQAYGITDQRISSSNDGGTWVELRTRAANGRRLLVLATPSDDGCHARVRMDLGGRPVWLHHAHVQLYGPMMVDYITFYGTDVETGARVRHRHEP